MSIKVSVYEVPRRGVNCIVEGRAVVGNAQVERLNRLPHILPPTHNPPDYIYKVGGGAGHPRRDGETFSGGVRDNAISFFKDRTG